MNIEDLFRIVPSKANRQRKHTPTGKTPEELGISLLFPRREDGKSGIRYRRTHYLYDRQKRRINWCWTTVRNKDGYYIGFREVYDADANIGFRDQWRARKARWRVREWALSQYNKSPNRDRNSWSQRAYTLKSDKS